MIIVCCRCNNVGVEMADERYEDDGLGEFPMAYPVPDGWIPDPDQNSEDGIRVVHPGCLTRRERQEAEAEEQQATRILLGEFD